MNTAILAAIIITEEIDFAEKNREALYNSVADVLEKVNAFTKWVGEKSMRMAQALAPVFEKIGKVVAAIEKDDALKNRLLEDEKEEEMGKQSNNQDGMFENKKQDEIGQ